MVLTQATDSLWGDKRLEFISDWLVLFFSVVFLFVYLSITYKIFKDVSIRKDRTFGDFLVLSALVSGSNWTLYGIAEVMVVLNQPLGGLAYLISATTVFIYSIKAYRIFWEMSYFNIFLYSFMVLLLIVIVIFSIFFLLGINNSEL